jgi:microcystin-dependent protein
MVAHRHINVDASARNTDPVQQVDSGNNDLAAFNDTNKGGTSGGAVKDGVAAPINGSAHTNIQPYMSMYFIIKAVA